MAQLITGLEKEHAARYALICGDPERVPKIAAELEGSREVRRIREYNIMEGKLKGERVLVASTGIGGPSAAILLEEMANLGTDTFIRIGTSGGIADGLKKGDAVITTGVYRKDGTSRSYVPDAYPAIAHPDVVRLLVGAAHALHIDHQVGVTMTVDGFYSENRILKDGGMISMSHNGYMPPGGENSIAEAKRMNVKNIEMEMGTVLALTTLWGLRGGGICLVSDVSPWRPTEEIIDPETGMERCIRAAVHALRSLIEEDRK